MVYGGHGGLKWVEGWFRVGWGGPGGPNNVKCCA